ncbi:MAG: glycosyltransferase [Lachnospiraceae bacterium]|nr:glycosyltransferase [Lachnospiraceae bacterium]
MSSSNDLISVVVPIYNVEKYLKKCIDSLIAQTYKNLQIILVDDGSPDRCGEICDAYAKQDKRITVLHKKNGGLSDARNAGIELCKGKYVTFVDSDDYLSEECILYLYKTLVENNADLSICGFKYITESGKIINKLNSEEVTKVMNQEEALYELCNNILFPNSAWAKLYKIEDFNDIRYPVGRLFEDIPTTYKLFFKTKKIAFGNKQLYYYLYREASISKQQFNPKRLDAIEFIEEMCSDISRKYPRLKSISNKRMLEEYIYAYTSLVLSNIKYKENIKNIFHKIKQTRFLVWRECLGQKMAYYILFSMFGPKSLELGIKIEQHLKRKH